MAPCDFKVRDYSYLGLEQARSESARVPAQLQAEASRDNPELCPVWQWTIGYYCGCENEVEAEDEVCRLCGDDTALPSPNEALSLLTSENKEISKTCGQLEFESNLPGSNCEQFQTLYKEGCCRNVELPSMSDDPDASSGGQMQWRVSLLGLLALAVLIS